MQFLQTKSFFADVWIKPKIGSGSVIATKVSEIFNPCCEFS